MDAIFTANGIEKTQGAVRLFTQSGTYTDTDFGRANDWTVVEITNSGVKEITVKVKEASSDKGYEDNVDAGYYKLLSDPISVSLGGEKLNYSDSTASNISYVLVYDDNDLFEL